MANTLPQTEPCIECGQGDFTPKEAVIFPSDGREEDRWIADSEAGVYDTDMPALPQTVYVQRGPNDGDLQVHDHGGFGGEEYVPKAALEAMRAERDAANARALRYKRERDGQARKISDAQNLSPASLEAFTRIENQRKELARLNKDSAELRAALADLTKEHKP